MTLHVYATSISGIFSVARFNDGIEVNSLKFGGDDPNGFLTPSDVIVALRSSRYTPLLVKAFVEQTSHTVVLKDYQPDHSGIARNFATFTLLGAKIDSIQLAGSATSHVVDTVHFNFATLDYNRPDDGVDFAWHVA